MGPFPFMVTMDGGRQLRVAFLAGTLARGGSEKQLIYMVRALQSRGVAVRVFALTRGEAHEHDLRSLSVTPVWIGQWRNPLLRLLSLGRRVRGFRPHVVQAVHFYANLYVALAAPLAGALGIGAIRNDGTHNVRVSGRWGPWLLRVPRAIITNSAASKRNAVALGASEDRIHVVPNALDLADFDRRFQERTTLPFDAGAPVVVAVARQIPEKRLDRFLRVVAMARQRVPSIRGVLLGDGIERAKLTQLATELGLLPDGVSFLGARIDVPAVLRNAHVALVTSDHEGFPNAVLEAMAARLPVVATPAGELRRLITDGSNGWVVDFDDLDAMAERVVVLAQAGALRERVGAAGRRMVEEHYTLEVLPGRLLEAYRALATRARLHNVARAVSNA